MCLGGHIHSFVGCHCVQACAGVMTCSPSIAGISSKSASPLMSHRARPTSAVWTMTSSSGSRQYACHGLGGRSTQCAMAAQSCSINRRRSGLTCRSDFGRHNQSSSSAKLSAENSSLPCSTRCRAICAGLDDEDSAALISTLASMTTRPMFRSAFIGKQTFQLRPRQPLGFGRDRMVLQGAGQTVGVESAHGRAVFRG